MSRITLSLPDELAALLSREARRLGTSVSEVARRALSTHLGVAVGSSRPLPFAGIGRSGRRHTARDAEQILAKEWSRAGRG